MKNYIELAEVAKNLLKAKKKMAKLNESRLQDGLTQRRIETLNTDLDWQGMEIMKLEHEAHAIAVNCSLAAPRESYGTVTFNPSAFHKYSYQPRLPECRLP
ncbi:MAG: hypothetical protein Q9M19_01355 [Mariprofundaceae bacterium]|nr:hypothetical protein [Mariprofundaceae bacterium]